VSEGFRRCFERAVTDGRSMSWYIDIDEGSWKMRSVGIYLRDVDCRRAHKHSRTTPSGPRPNGRQSFKESKLLVRPPYANVIGVEANSNE
jgi:hypothetical protein